MSMPAIEPLAPEMQRLADLLARARREQQYVPGLPPELVPPDRRAAYHDAVAQALGWQPAGWKVAATSANMQRRLRSPEPIYGRVFRQFIVDSPYVLEHGPLLNPLTECEFALELGQSLPPRDRPYTWEEVADAVAAVRPAIEVAQCRFRDADMPPIEGVLADGSASGHLVLGQRFEDWRARNLTSAAVALYTDGRLRREGTGADAMGDPLNVLHWLANERAALGDGLEAGEVVSTGTCTRMIPPLPGETHLADFGPLGQVEVRFTA